MSSLHDLYVLFPELFIALNACVILFLSSLAKQAQIIEVRRMGWSCVVVLLGSVFLLLVPNYDNTIYFRGMFEVNHFTIFMKTLVLLAAASVLILSFSSQEYKKIPSFEYPLLMLFSVLGIMIVISANDFLLLFMGLELQALPLYVLAAFRRDQSLSSEAAVKYFVLGALSTGLFLFGVSLLYGFSGTTNFQALHVLFLGVPPKTLPLGGLLGMIFIIAAIGFKVSAAPFHMWTPDVYEGTPTPVTTFLATASKIAGVALAIRILYVPFLAFAIYWQTILIVIAALSMVLGAFGAIAQQNMKRLLAYSAIGHMGYILAALSVGTEQGVQAILIYLTLYIVMTLGIFGCLMILRGGKEIVSLRVDDLAGLSKRHPGVAFMVGVLMFSFAGIPPLGGFFSKLLLFMVIVEKGFLWLAILGVLSSVVACFYYLRVIKVMYIDTLKDEELSQGNTLVLSWQGMLLLIFITLSTLLFFLILPWMNRTVGGCFLS